MELSNNEINNSFSWICSLVKNQYNSYVLSGLYLISDVYVNKWSKGRYRTYDLSDKLYDALVNKQRSSVWLNDTKYTL